MASFFRPPHVLYGGAHLFSASTFEKVAQVALKFLRQSAEEDRQAWLESLPASIRIPGDRIWPSVEQRLQEQATANYCIDFEDGFGVRSAHEEDTHAARCCQEVAALAGTQRPARLGVRIRSLASASHARSLKTLQILMTHWPRAAAPTFSVTLPKVESTSDVVTLCDALSAQEHALGLAEGSTPIELMIESPRGLAAVAALTAAAGARLCAVHVGAYDYLSSLGVAAQHQHLDHAHCAYARHVLQNHCVASGVQLFDGATHLLPVAKDVSDAGSQRQIVRRAMSTHIAHVARALCDGIDAGWDLHPHQLVARYAANVAYFRSGREDAAARLRAFIHHAATARVSGGVFDDAATALGLVQFFRRGVACGAFSLADLETSGLSPTTLPLNDFHAIVAANAAPPSGPNAA